MGGILRERLWGTIERLSAVGKQPDGAVTRLALTDEDREARDLLMGWMEELGLEV